MRCIWVSPARMQRDWGRSVLFCACVLGARIHRHSSHHFLVVVVGLALTQTTQTTQKTQTSQHHNITTSQHHKQTHHQIMDRLHSSVLRTLQHNHTQAPTSPGVIRGLRDPSPGAQGQRHSRDGDLHHKGGVKTVGTRIKRTREQTRTSDTHTDGDDSTQTEKTAHQTEMTAHRRRRQHIDGDDNACALPSHAHEPM